MLSAKASPALQAMKASEKDTYSARPKGQEGCDPHMIISHCFHLHEDEASSLSLSVRNCEGAQVESHSSHNLGNDCLPVQGCISSTHPGGSHVPQLIAHSLVVFLPVLDLHARSIQHHAYVIRPIT